MFSCTADSGAFALTWNGNTIEGIAVNTDQDELKRLLEMIPGMNHFLKASDHINTFLNVVRNITGHGFLFHSVGRRRGWAGMYLKRK